jgi:hypothetical protein
MADQQPREPAVPPSAQVPAMNEVWSGTSPTDPIDGHRRYQHGWWRWPVGATVVSIAGGFVFFLLTRMILVVTGWGSEMACAGPLIKACGPLTDTPQYGLILAFGATTLVLLAFGYLLPHRREWHTARVLLAVLGSATALAAAGAGAFASAAAATLS